MISTLNGSAQHGRILDDKMGRALKAGYKIPYTDATAADDDYILRIAGDIEPDLLGSDLVVHDRGGGHQ